MQNQSDLTSHPTTLPQMFFTSNEVFDREQELIFRNSWLCVGGLFKNGKPRFAEPGDFEIVCVAGDEIIIIRDKNNLLKAHFNVCRHRGTQILSENSGKCKNVIRCPYHNWCYSLDGNLIAAPNMADDFQQAAFSLKSVQVAQWSGLVFLSIDPSLTFEEFIAPLDRVVSNWTQHNLVEQIQIKYEIEANWKLIFQNFSECYHCACVHPQLNRLTPSKAEANLLSEGPILGGPMKLIDGSETLSTDGKLTHTRIPTLSNEQARLISYYTIFPSLFFSPHPDYVLAHFIQPISVSKTKVVCSWNYVGPENSEVDYQRAVEFWDTTNKQDWEMCEKSQIGISSTGYVPGPYSTQESLLPKFDAHYLKVMNET